MTWARRDALAVLGDRADPDAGTQLSRSKIAAALRRGGRQRRVEERAVEIQTALRAEQLEAPPLVADAMGATVAALVAVIAELTTQIARLETELADRFEQHPDAKIIRSLPGLGMILGARVLAEFGDDPNRYADAKSRKNYAGTSPITRASGKHRVVLARYARNRRLADACYLWAFAALTASPGARAFYDQRRAAGDTHNRALRALANRLVGILHGCLRHHTLYDEHTAWAHRTPTRRLTPTARGMSRRRRYSGGPWTRRSLAARTASIAHRVPYRLHPPRRAGLRPRRRRVLRVGAPRSRCRSRGRRLIADGRAPRRAPGAPPSTTCGISRPTASPRHRLARSSAPTHQIGTRGVCTVWPIVGNSVGSMV